MGRGSAWPHPVGLARDSRQSSKIIENNGKTGLAQATILPVGISMTIGLTDRRGLKDCSTTRLSYIGVIGTRSGVTLASRAWVACNAGY